MSDYLTVNYFFFFYFLIDPHTLQKNLFFACVLLIKFQKMLIHIPDKKMFSVLCFCPYFFENSFV